MFKTYKLYHFLRFRTVLIIYLISKFILTLIFDFEILRRKSIKANITTSKYPHLPSTTFRETLGTSMLLYLLLMLFLKNRPFLIVLNRNAKS